ncbi:SDR family NAD(P)-dependent oxidoreductase [Micromonospora chersina]|uniref:SDR family NAD(P)-dependent oxidoreductase n=1 Tax=Micromonospora chersina TaxID=47854 RepID=UPI0034563E9A
MVTPPDRRRGTPADVQGTSRHPAEAEIKATARRGWNVAATLRDPAKADPSFAELPGVLVLPLDVTKPETIRAAVSAATERFGQLDAVVNNAGYAQLGTVEEVSLDQWRDQYETNVFGVVAVIQAILPQVRQRRAGHILITSSMGGQVSLPTMSSYTSSKFAVEGIGEGLAKEVAPLGIDVTIVEPAGFTTPFFQNLRQAATPLDDYDPARDAMAAFGKTSVRADVEKSMSAIADITGIENPPLRLALGSFGLTMVRGKLAELAENYAAYEEITRAVD